MKAETVAAMFLQLITFHVLKLCCTVQLCTCISINHWKHKEMPHPNKASYSTAMCLFLKFNFRVIWAGVCLLDDVEIHSRQTDRQTDRQLVQCAFRLPVYCCV